MIIGGIYSFKDGEKIIEEKYNTELSEVKKVINSIDALKHKTKLVKKRQWLARNCLNPVR